MMKKKKYLLRISFVVTTLFLLYIVLFQYRHFFKVGDMVFTFWKTEKGCYIMPYKYMGITIPKDNYMKAEYSGGIIIFIGEDSTLYIFPMNIYRLGADTIECSLSSYKYKYYPYVSGSGLDNVNAFYDMRDHHYNNLGYPYINVDMRGMYVEIRDIKGTRQYEPPAIRPFHD